MLLAASCWVACDGLTSHPGRSGNAPSGFMLGNPTPVSEHVNLPGHSVYDLRLIPLELIHTNRDSVRKAREVHLIDKAKTLEPQGLNRRDELHE